MIPALHLVKVVEQQLRADLQRLAGRPGCVLSLDRGRLGGMAHHGAVIGVYDRVGPRTGVDPLPADQEPPGPLGVNAGLIDVVGHRAILLPLA